MKTMISMMQWLTAGCLLLIMSMAGAAEIYKVRGVAADDHLNMRNAAGVQGSKVVATIPPNGSGMVATGREKKLGQSTWVEVHWSGKAGWVNKYYLTQDTAVAQAADKQPAAQPKTGKGSDVFMRCGGKKPLWSMQISESQLKIKIMDGTEYTAPVEFRKQSENNTSIAVVAGRRPAKGALTAAFLQKVEVCSNHLSDKKYPYAITALLDGSRAMSGCCEISQAHH